MTSLALRYLPSLSSGLLVLIVVSTVVLPWSATGQSSWSTTNCPKSMKQAEHWYFGEKAGISFEGGNAVPDTAQRVMTSFKASASISDSMGNFLFLTNGDKVWDRTFNLMPNATDLYGDLGATQPCIIVPWPGDSNQYYLFTLDILKFSDTVNYTTKGLNLTIIDMSLRNGLGDAQPGVLNKPILSPVTQKITAVKHRNGKDYWVITHEWDSDRFYAYLLSGPGMGPPVISSAGTFHGGKRTEANNAVGYMKASPDGSKLALVVSHKKVIELLDFNNETGVVSNARSYTTVIPGVNPYGIEFSPDSRMLYATVFETGGVEIPSRPSFILQFDLRNGLTTPFIVDSLPGIRTASMQLAPDGRIYLTRTNNILSKRDSLEVIYNPNRQGINCNLSRLDNVAGSGFPLLGRKSIYSLPNLVQSFVDIPAFRWDSVCQGDVTSFRITNKANIDSVLWDFGDGAVSTNYDPFHAYATPGKYNVKLTEYFSGSAFVDSMSVTSYRLPEISLADTILLYKGSSISLNAGEGFMNYLWSSGAQEPRIVVSDEGSYWARVKDFNCCENSDTAYVKVFEYFIPNAFTPNGDGLNDVFRVNGLYRNIAFQMVVYDRWGRLVFESVSIDNGWDGTFKGALCDPDTYVWKVSVTFLGQDIITQGNIKFSGTVTLVR